MLQQVGNGFQPKVLSKTLGGFIAKYSIEWCLRKQHGSIFYERTGKSG
jgi:hypothetical protein